MGPVGSPARSKALGLLALAAEDRETALTHLPRARALELSLLGEDARFDEGVRERIAFWKDKLEQAAKLT